MKAAEKYLKNKGLLSRECTKFLIKYENGNEVVLNDLLTDFVEQEKADLLKQIADKNIELIEVEKELLDTLINQRKAEEETEHWKQEIKSLKSKV